jgi:MoxR-like ATPase
MDLYRAVASIQRRFKIVGRANELRLVLACVKAGKNVMLEGPVGVGKSVLADASARYLKVPLFRVDGDERYTEQKLTGWFDPALVLKQGYQPDALILGPLANAMREGGILFVNEINRMPEGVQNVLLPCLEERRLVIPQYGAVEAENGFMAIATQNPVEFVATSHLSEALRDRFDLVRLRYQPAEEEIEIVRVNVKNRRVAREDGLIEQAVGIVHATRNHPLIKRGASVRAAISVAEIAYQLGGEDAIGEAAAVALPHRIELVDDSTTSASDVLGEIVDDLKKKARRENG